MKCFVISVIIVYEVNCVNIEKKGIEDRYLVVSTIL